MAMHLVTKQTTAAEISANLLSLLARSSFYLAEDDVELASISRDLDKLGRVSAAERSYLLIFYYTALGDRESSIYWAENAKKLHYSRAAIERALVLMYVNLGYFTDSRGPLNYLLTPENGAASMLYSERLVGMPLRQLKASHLRAREMQIVDLPELPESVEATLEIMDFWGESDDDYSAALDVAGEVLRSHRLFIMDRGFSFYPVGSPSDGSAPYVKATMRLDVSFEQSLDLTDEYLEKLARSRIKVPQSLIFEFLSSEEQ